MESNFGRTECWFASLLAVSVIYGIGVALYRLVSHPLAKFPGPFIAKISGMYMLYHAWRGDRHLEFWKLHDKYGPVVRFSPNGLSFNSHTSLKQIYGFRGNVRKAEFYDAFVHPAPNTHNTRDKEMHARKRRVLSQAFSDNAIKEMERYILLNIRTFCDEIMRHVDKSVDTNGWSSPKNMSDWFNYLAMDILGDLCFGKAFHMLEKSDNRYAINLVNTAAQRHLICGTMPIIDKLSLDRILFHKISAGRSKYMAYSRSQLSERTKLGDETDRRDFFYHLLKAKDPETGAGFTMPELWGESNLLIIAGSDTTSTAMAATLFYLTRNPSALSKATEEVRSAFSTAEDIHQGPVLTGCIYLRACIDESMRLSPSVPGLLPREVLEGGMEIDGHFVPKGTVVGTPHYTIHHNPIYYPGPFAFSPERWIPGSLFLEPKYQTAVEVTRECVTHAQSAFCPFSVGPRGCIGKGIAYVEMTTALARVLFLYDIRRAVGVPDPGEGAPGSEWGRHRVDEFQLVDIFTSSIDGPMVEFKKRAII